MACYTVYLTRIRRFSCLNHGVRAALPVSAALDSGPGRRLLCLAGTGVRFVCIIVKELSFLPANAPTLYDKIDKWVVRIIKSISYVSAVCLVGIMLVAFFNVLGEKLRQAGLPVTGIPASTEIVQYLHIPVVFLAAAYVTLDRGHTRIDLLCSKFPRTLQTICALIGNLCGVGICALVSWRGFVQMGKFMARHSMSSVSGVGFPLWPFALIMAGGFALLSLSFVWAIVRQFCAPAKTEEHPAPDSENGGGQ